MAALVAAIHVFLLIRRQSWMRGTSPRMTASSYAACLNPIGQSQV